MIGGENKLFQITNKLPSKIMSKFRDYITTLEKLSLVTCSKDVLPMLERALKNVEPILRVDTSNVAPLFWQNELDITRLLSCRNKPQLSLKDLERNTTNFYEDYIVVGPKPTNK